MDLNQTVNPWTSNDQSQHMCWTKRGAHLPLQVRCAALNGELLHVFNDGSQPSGPARSAYLGIGYPTVFNGSIAMSMD